MSNSTVETCPALDELAAKLYNNSRSHQTGAERPQIIALRVLYKRKRIKQIKKVIKVKTKEFLTSVIDR